MTVTSPELRLILRPLTGRATTCEFAIFIGGVAVWPALGVDDQSFEIQIDDLLGYLTDFWKPLMLRQVYPIAVNPARPSDLRRAAEQRWGDLPRPLVEAEDEALSHFEQAHDLARCFAGVFGLPSFWVFRSGADFIVETAGSLWNLPYEEVRGRLDRLGNEICEGLVEVDRERWGDAIDAWHHRSDADSTALLAWSAGLNPSVAKQLIEEDVLEAPRDFDDAANDDDELRIAARMVGTLPPEQIREIISLARQFDRRDAKGLRKLAQECTASIASGPERAKPFHQGEAAANFVREWLRVPSGKAVEIFEIAAELGLDVRHETAEPPTLDGLAVWGKRHGPGVFLNEASARLARGDEDIRQNGSARVTLAHELCHLLLDGGHALSVVEVLKARMPINVEQRARSFAGEFLLPSRVAGQHWLDAGRPTNRDGLNALLEELIGTFGVTRSVAAWKLEHGARAYDVDLSVILDALAPYR